MRALTESYYGRVARLFVLKSDESMPEELRGGALSALMLRHAADELLASGDETEAAGLVAVKLTNADRRRFEKRLNRLVADMHGADDPSGERHVLAYALFRARSGLSPRTDDA